MPAERSFSASSPRFGSSSSRRSNGPMSLSRILRGPGFSPSNEFSTADPILRGLSTTSPLSVICTPTPHKGAAIHSASEPSKDSNNKNQTPQGSPNPFLISPSTDSPTTPPVTLSYQSFFGDEPLTSPVLDSPTRRGTRALRRHGAVALLVPQTPSASNWLVDVSAVTDGDSTPSNLDAGSPDDDKTPRARPRMLPVIEASEIVGDVIEGPLESSNLNRIAAARSDIRAFQLGDVEFTSFTPPSSYRESESGLISRIDTKGISQAQFAELIAFCSICRTYMTKRSALYHGWCDSSRSSQDSRRATAAKQESATKTLLRLMTSDPMGGVPEALFCSLFSTCPGCHCFMTWDASHFHDCFDSLCAEVDSEGSSESDSELGPEEEDDSKSQYNWLDL